VDADLDENGHPDLVVATQFQSPAPLRGPAARRRAQIRLGPTVN
jgi:hypothetical protein